MNSRPLFLPGYLFMMMTLCSSTLFSCTRTSDKPAQPLNANDTIITSANIDTAKKYYLALGDSYTIGQSVKVNERYPVQAVDKLRATGFNVEDAEIIAVSGWTTGDLLKALKDTTAVRVYDMVTLLIGVNNQYQGRSIDEYRLEFTSLLKKAIVFSGNRPKRVIVLSIPDYSVTPFANYSDKVKISGEIDAFNQANKNISSSFQVNYVDITNESRKAANDPSLIAYDGLHFSGKEYSIWTSILLPVTINALR